MHLKMKNITHKLLGFNLEKSQLPVFPSRGRDLDFLSKHSAATLIVLKQIKSYHAYKTHKVKKRIPYNSHMCWQLKTVKLETSLYIPFYFTSLSSS